MSWYCRYYEALRSFQQAISIKAEDPLAHFRMGNVFFAMKKYPEARKVLQGGGYCRVGCVCMYGGGCQCP